MSDQHILHFTLGPVQGFVSQARRIRDLWAGSFILSYLSAHAMKCVLDNGGSIVFPTVHSTDKNSGDKKITDPLLAAVMGTPLSSNTNPNIGSVPNRFKATVTSDFDPALVTQAVNQQWQNIAGAVYADIVEPFLFSDNKALQGQRQALWDQQIAQFWQIAWVKGDNAQANADDHRWLDQRKNWRTAWLPEQQGEKCSLMGDWQELSTFSIYQAQQRRDFWQALALHTRGGARNIRKHEYLCAISLVKRLFPTLSHASLVTTLGWVPGGDLQRLSNWPSTTYMSALSWLTDCYQNSAKHEPLNRYLNLICDQLSRRSDLQLLMSEQASHFPKLIAARTDKLKVDSAGKSLYPDDIDGDLLNKHALANSASTYLSVDALRNDDGTDPDAVLRSTLGDGLHHLHTELEKAETTTGEAAKPRSYYALLIMDGDRLGALLNDYAQSAPEAISASLSQFTQKVAGIVEEHYGLTIYAGGDDVLAMLPINTALHCAQQLNNCYRAEFADHQIEGATASAAVLYVHHQYPLSNALKTAHHMLDGVAKDKNGRNSCVVTVLNSGGDHLQWVNAWDCPASESNEAETMASPVSALLNLVGAFRAEQFPRGFPHKLKQQYPYLDSTLAKVTQESSDITTTADMTKPEQLHKLVLAELLMTVDAAKRGEKRVEAEQAAEAYLAAACHYRNIAGADRKTNHQQRLHGVQFDAGLVARFLTREDQR